MRAKGAGDGIARRGGRRLGLRRRLLFLVAFFPASLGLAPLPRHVGVVMDGNGRWSSGRGLPRTAGHAEGAKRAIEMVELCERLGVEYLTLFAFSSENWKRPTEEVNELMRLLESTIRLNKTNLRDRGIRLSVIGDSNRLPQGVRDAIFEMQHESHPKPEKMTLCLALSYGGRNDMLQAAKALARDIHLGKVNLEDADEDTLAGYMSTGSENIPNPDLIIRTANEFRLSNFFLYQAAYSELYISPKLWPDWGKSDFLDALEDFQRRERRFGQVSPGANSPTH